MCIIEIKSRVCFNRASYLGSKKSTRDFELEPKFIIVTYMLF